jgi:NAD(P)-dependent dehydrogenase (short-subunit alcohol dehydrogenase family)
MSGKLFDLTGRAALVTGGSKGLGKAMARGFAEAGADVLIASRHGDELVAAAAEIRAATGDGVRVAHVVADLTRRDDTERLADAAIAALGRVDILVNNAGSNTPQPIDAIRDEDWDSLVELNLSSCMALTRALVGPMKERGWGRIIHISSIMGLISAPGRNAYSATKSALIGLTRASANDLGPSGITVNCIAPGPFLTDLPASVFTEAQIAAFAQKTVLGRWGRPEELVGPALLLASEAGSYITGATLVVDGGTLVKAF